MGTSDSAKKRRTYEDENGVKYRRQSRSSRIDTTRQWLNGTLDQNAPDYQRRTREGKLPKPKTLKTGAEGVVDAEGTVVQVNRKNCRVITLHGQEVTAEASSALIRFHTHTLVVGDRVRLVRSPGDGFLLTQIMPRKNHLLRSDPDMRKGKQLVMAANLDIAILVFAFKNPVFNGKLLDRYLIRTASLGLRPLICINKVDLLQSLPVEISHLKKIGYRVLKISARFGDGMEAFQKAVKNKRGVLTGPSGAGKSTIIKFLKPGLSINIGQVRASDGKGRHTTSRSNLYWTDSHTWLIDTPGIKTVSMRDISREAIISGFPEIHRLSGACKFRNCSHTDDNGCAVTKAVATGQVPLFRYESYLRMLEDN